MNCCCSGLNGPLHFGSWTGTFVGNPLQIGTMKLEHMAATTSGLTLIDSSPTYGFIDIWGGDAKPMWKFLPPADMPTTPAIFRSGITNISLEFDPDGDGDRLAEGCFAFVSKNGNRDSGIGDVYTPAFAFINDRATGGSADERGGEADTFMQWYDWTNKNADATSVLADMSKTGQLYKGSGNVNDGDINRPLQYINEDTAPDSGLNPGDGTGWLLDGPLYVGNKSTGSYGLVAAGSPLVIRSYEDDGAENRSVNVKASPNISAGDDRYIFCGVTDADADRFQLTTNGNVYLNTGGIFTGGTAKTNIDTYASYFSKSWTGVWSGEKRGVGMIGSFSPDTGSSNPVGTGLLMTATWANTGTDTAMTQVRGGFFKAVMARDATATLTALDAAQFTASCTLTNTNSPTVSAMTAGKYEMQFSGTNYTVNLAYTIYIPSPTAPGSGTTIGRMAAINIDDQKDYSTHVDAIRVRNQTGGASRGNIALDGGDWDDGHVQLGSAHLWYDSANTTIRGKISTPSSATDGTDILGGGGGGGDSYLEWAGL